MEKEELLKWGRELIDDHSWHYDLPVADMIDTLREVIHKGKVTQVYDLYLIGVSQGYRMAENDRKRKRESRKG